MTVNLTATDKPAIEAVIGDTVGIPLEFVEGAAETPVNFAAGDILRIELFDGAGASVQSWQSTGSGTITFTAGSNLATINQLATDLANLLDGFPYRCEIVRKNAAAQYRTYTLDASFIGRKRRMGTFS